ncbi:sulfurtransferase [Ectothiorhodospira lacustris]|uniref:sulfurtransferase n=1 Tax=Ectothiorhodospira lacustris TaxID=2899127 RepID=UPI001EE84009|nr:sulfurtransferase [Ectothiorhodospira lacustris]MCG5501978.1 sulfurtransferase [Ectothiorhodospira lacustris]
MKNLKNQLPPGVFLILICITLAISLSACGDERSKESIDDSTGFRINSPADIAQKSAEEYDDNHSGLITGRTLKSWIDNWEENRPDGITGKLIIIQATRGPSGFEFIKPDNQNVFTYLETGWREPRTNGVSEIAGIVLSGPSIDALIRRYGIDVNNDMIVCAQGTGGNAAMNQGRCWYTFRYWGVDHRNLAVLNGGNNHLNGDWTAGDFTNQDFSAAIANQPSPIINRQISNVKDLRVDNTALQATLEDIIDVLPTRDINNTSNGVFLWDGRSLDQYSAGEASEAGGPLANRYASFQNQATRQGHPRGSVNLNWTNLIDTSTGLYKPKAALRAYLNGEVDENGRGFVDGTYQYLGIGNAYQDGDTVYIWCETAARAAVTQIVTAVILGLPTRLYDASTIEWNSLTGDAYDRDGVLILPSDSPWRTDVLSEPYFPNLPANIAPRNAWSDPQNPAAVAPPRIVDPYAPRSNAVILEDQAYKALDDGEDIGNGNDTGNSGGSGGGVVLPPNPCGG